MGLLNYANALIERYFRREIAWVGATQHGTAIAPFPNASIEGYLRGAIALMGVTQHCMAIASFPNALSEGYFRGAIALQILRIDFTAYKIYSCGKGSAFI